MAPTYIISGTYQTVSTTPSAELGSVTTNDVSCMKHSVAIAGLNRFETQSMYESRHCRASQYLPHYIQFKLVGHSWPGLYKSLALIPGLAMCLFQDLF